ncbi:MAG: site-specific integrase [Corynebacterium sp.]|uniref:tyrosine-type recombinase/integrase n=1 Tax=Corynebacterium sp. TaxID=1720 RepID=UPI00264A0E37|nr:tyrosine-type recombinase/integrase [Corynebacterium sp.]MDN6281709.1 site-specific integrase [Corynebacterium sp.]MDN6304197.1 site-specific integrase [Corynebacterium sp.]MDN6351784.1 site-specific integrase [Corynebacterium sp.]MDN6367494.1 site-specific integrase [Corynebacterium sp.]MDN6374723.1 site-specific integrase [Corynebacterium sp.]
MNALAIELQSYFTSFARNQRDLSPHTISSYRDTWRLLITYLSDTTGTRADRIDFADLTVDSVTGFLNHLENDRHNSTATRNARLSGIRAVLVHALPAQLDDAGTITRILAIPAKRHPKPQVEYLTDDEADALIAAPDQSRWTGRRDHSLLVLALQTGLRISELHSLNLNDIDTGTGAHVRCTGKGRRQRCTPLTRITTTIMSNYLVERTTRPGTALFCGPHGARLSRDALEHRIRIHTATATRVRPSLATKHVTMHTLRHTAAMNLLAEGVDISVIALWLGHQQTQSTDAYLHANMAIKQAAIDRTRGPNVAPGVYRPEPDILAWLAAL